MLRYAQHDEPRGRSSPWDRYPHIQDAKTALTFIWNMTSEDGWDHQFSEVANRVTGPNNEEGIWINHYSMELGNVSVPPNSVLWGDEAIPLANAFVDKYYSLWFEKWEIQPGDLQNNPRWMAFVQQMERMINEAHAGDDFSEDPNLVGHNMPPHVGSLKIMYHPHSSQHPQAYHLETAGGAHIADGNTLVEMMSISTIINKSNLFNQ